MFNLSTQEVGLSIENSPLTKLNGIVYQEYHNFLGNSVLKELKNLENLNLVKLEKQFVYQHYHGNLQELELDILNKEYIC